LANQDLPAHDANGWSLQNVRTHFTGSAEGSWKNSHGNR